MFLGLSAAFPVGLLRIPSWLGKIYVCTTDVLQMFVQMVCM